MLYNGEGRSKNFIPGNGELLHEGRGDRTDDVTEAVNTTNLEKTDTGKGILNRDFFNKVEEAVMTFTK